jgi:23S rRNA (cytosine1962-C5)-methyltransferase
MTNTPKLFLKSGKDKSVKRLHPWIFSGAIGKTEGNPAEGDVVDLYDNEKNFIAKGHYQPDSITIRILTFENEEIDSTFWEKRIQIAVNHRISCGLYNSETTNVFRLIHGEGDFLPGLIVDFYNGIAVIQCHSGGMYLARIEIANALKTIMGKKLIAVYDKSAGTLPFKFTEKTENGFLIGEANSEIEVLENGFKFLINFVEGQKTGFFIDQRENRQLLSQYSKNRDAANMFSYTGGFSVYALGAGAKSVHSIDSSAKANELAVRNVVANNFHDKHEVITEDILKYIDNIDQKYDLIILDPPAFAKHTRNLTNALQAYKRLNAKAIKSIRAGGIIFTFSCSQVVSRDDFRRSVFAAAASTGRQVKILHQLTQPNDHPISIYHPEGEYLKGLVIKVE